MTPADKERAVEEVETEAIAALAEAVVEVVAVVEDEDEDEEEGKDNDNVGMMDDNAGLRGTPYDLISGAGLN